MTPVIHKLKGTSWGDHTFTDEGFCGFLHTVSKDDPCRDYVAPFTHQTCVSTCQDCEDAYALALLGELP